MPNLKGFFATFLVAVALIPSARAAEPVEQNLTLEDCINLALQHNLDLQIERRNPIRAALDIDAAKGGYYDPNLTVQGRYDSQQSGLRTDSDNRLVPGSQSDTDSLSASLGGIALPYSGTRYQLLFNAQNTTGSRQIIDTNGITSVPFESSSGNAAIVITQPLLKNLWMDSGRLNIAIAKNNLQFVELTLKRQVMNIITQVEKAYYELIYSYDSVKVQEMSLELAKRSLDETRKRFEVGTVAELETKQTESQVAAREADLLTARRNLDIRQNALKRLISDNYAALHRVVLKPTETLEANPQVFDVQLSWDKGLSDRPDVDQARLDLESLGLQLKYDRNQLYPQLDLAGSYGLGGSGVGYNDTLDSITSRDQPRWYIGGTFSIPIGNRAARSRYRSDQVREEQLLLGLKSLEQGIMVEIDDAIKQASSSYDRVQATRKAREYAEAALDAEQKRLENGKSTAFFVLSLQNDLTSARSSEIRAKADYNNSLVELSFREGSTLQRHSIDWDVKTGD